MTAAPHFSNTVPSPSQLDNHRRVRSPAIWLIPYAQLKSAAHRRWQINPPPAPPLPLDIDLAPDVSHAPALRPPLRPAPQILTIRQWARSLGVIAKTATDIHYDPAIDRIQAQLLLQKAGVPHAPACVSKLLDMTYEIAPRVQAITPGARLDWARQQTALFQPISTFQIEAAIGHIALMWAATSAFETDILWQKRETLLGATEHIYATYGLQTDALLQALLQGYEHKVSWIEWLDADVPQAQAQQAQNITQHPVASFEDLVQQTAHQVLSGAPLQTTALIALDRELTRRVCAVLVNRGVTIKDETGWALSTASVAAAWLAWLCAVAPQATSDQVLAALTTAPQRFAPTAVAKLERRIRQHGHLLWTAAGCAWLGDWPIRFAKPRLLSDWLDQTRALMTDVLLWEATCRDDVGRVLLQALHMDMPWRQAALPAVTLTYAEFVAWVRAVLEATRFRLPIQDPIAPAQDQRDDSQMAGGEFSESLEDSELLTAPKTVVVLPLAQLWGRRFDHVIVPSCDERHLPASPALPGDWSAAQRLALGLTTREQLASQQTQAWKWLCQQPKIDLLWQYMEGDEMLTKSPLLEALELAHTVHTAPALVAANLGVPDLGAPDLRGADLGAPNLGAPDLSEPDARRQITTGSNAATAYESGVVIDWQQLAPAQLSASAYADLRACPYRFYATRLLALQPWEELDEALDKRDFGTWLHRLLHDFHERRKARAPEVTSQTDPAVDLDADLLDACAWRARQNMGLNDAAFLPFSLVWQQTRQAYLAWLKQHESTGASYEMGEVRLSYPMHIAGKIVELKGVIDRVDRVDQMNRVDQVNRADQVEQVNQVNQVNGVMSAAHATWLLLDYKTEAAQKTRQRLQDAADDELQDTQLAFYAVLFAQAHQLPSHAIRAAYVNVVERANGRDVTKTHELPDLDQRQEALLSTLENDLLTISQGQALRALGQGETCEFCSARGLCRKDFL